MTVRVFLVDDHEVIRVGMRALIDPEPDLEIVGEASAAEEALAHIAAARPDVAVVDLQLGAISGIEVCREVRSLYPDIRCLILSAFSGERDVAAAVMAGAAGYVLKQRAKEELIDAIRATARGEQVLDQALLQDVMHRMRTPSGSEALLQRLSTQERHVLERVAAGRTNRQIAEELSLAEKTVRNYVSNLLAKLGMQRRSEAAAFAARLEERGEFRPQR